MLMMEEMPSPYRYNNLNKKIDIIGDVHGCMRELEEIFKTMGYNYNNIWEHEGRIPAFCGDLTDRGYKSIEVSELIIKMVKNNKGIYVIGNHCDKLYRYLKGSKVKINNGLETTVHEFENLDKNRMENFRRDFIWLYESSSFYVVLDNGKLIVSHGGVKEEMIGKLGGRVRKQCLYGDITGEKDEQGYPIRENWFLDYRGNALNIYGHTPCIESKVIHNTLNVDGGCVFGGELRAFRYPENKLIKVKSYMKHDEEAFRRMEKYQKALASMI